MVTITVWLATLATGYGLDAPNVKFPSKSECETYIAQVEARSRDKRGMNIVYGVCAAATIIKEAPGQ